MADEKQENKEEKKAWTKPLELGFNAYHLVAETVDLENPNPDYVSRGYLNAHGIPIIIITLPKQKAILEAEYVLKKYKK